MSGLNETEAISVLKLQGTIFHELTVMAEQAEKLAKENELLNEQLTEAKAESLKAKVEAATASMPELDGDADRKDPYSSKLYNGQPLSDIMPEVGPEDMPPFHD